MSPGSPFDAALPCFRQAASNLASTMKPPRGPPQQVEDQTPFKACSGTTQHPEDKKMVDAPSEGASLTSVPRRRSIARADFSSPPSLASVKEVEYDDEPQAMAPSSGLLSLDRYKSSSLPDVMPNRAALQKGYFGLPLPLPLPLRLQLPRPLQPACRDQGSCKAPACKACNGAGAQVRSFLAAAITLMLLVLFVQLLRPGHFGRQTPIPGAAAPAPRKFLGGLTQPMLEHFTAAQGSNYGMGMGLEEASSQASSHLNPARDFQTFMSTHLGWGDAGGSSPDSFLHQISAQAEFDQAKAGGVLGHAGGFDSRLVTITSSGVSPAHELQDMEPDQAALRSDERRDLEDDSGADDSSSADDSSADVSSGESVNTQQNALAESTGVADPANLANSAGSPPSKKDKKAAKATQKVVAVESTNPNGQIGASGTVTGASSGTAGGSNIAGGTTTGTGTATGTDATTGNSRIGPIMAGGVRMGSGKSSGSGGTSGVSSVGTNKGAQIGVSSASLNSGSSASGLRNRASSTGSGTAASASKDSLETVPAGTFATTTTNPGAAASLVQVDSSGGSFAQPLSGG